MKERKGKGYCTELDEEVEEATNVEGNVRDEFAVLPISLHRYSHVHRVRYPSCASHHFFFFFLFPVNIPDPNANALTLQIGQGLRSFHYQTPTLCVCVSGPCKLQFQSFPIPTIPSNTSFSLILSILFKAFKFYHDFL